MEEESGGFPPPPAVEWVAEVWVDPDWYAVQQSPDPCPSPDDPRMVPLASSGALIGRKSISRAVDPEIDCSADIGVSRRHAHLTTDGYRWWIEDLQSANGTFIGRHDQEAVPIEPLPPSQRHELTEDDRIYLGAWTRIVVRRAAPGELDVPGAVS
jgi:FHA domain